MGVNGVLERLLDSVIIIDHLNDVPEATDFLISLDPSTTAISVISHAEILTGLDESGAEKVRPLLYSFEMLSIDTAAAEMAATLRRQHGWKLPDAFQAALAILNKILLTTRNTKDFDPEKHSFVEIPYILR